MSDQPTEVTPPPEPEPTTEADTEPEPTVVVGAPPAVRPPSFGQGRSARGPRPRFDDALLLHSCVDDSTVAEVTAHAGPSRRADSF